MCGFVKSGARCVKNNKASAVGLFCSALCWRLLYGVRAHGRTYSTVHLCALNTLEQEICEKIRDTKDNPLSIRVKL
jgi:hypothetical protein